MTALSKIEAAGFRVFLKGENLGIAPADNLTPSQREFLKSHKAEIINELHNQIVWAELPEPAHGALMVTCYTPALIKATRVGKRNKRTRWLTIPEIKRYLTGLYQSNGYRGYKLALHLLLMLALRKAECGSLNETVRSCHANLCRTLARVRFLMYKVA
jgi:hypothetical protein